MGAIMGSKNLKAVAFRGTQSIKIAKPKEFMVKAKELIKMANSSDTLKYRFLGPPVNVMNFNKMGCLPVKNFQTGYWDKAINISGELCMKMGC
jgi:aldehyde:ferredoxin oxidoreductase